MSTFYYNNQLVGLRIGCSANKWKCPGLGLKCNRCRQRSNDSIVIHDYIEGASIPINHNPLIKGSYTKRITTYCQVCDSIIQREQNEIQKNELNHRPIRASDLKSSAKEDKSDSLLFDVVCGIALIVGAFLLGSDDEDEEDQKHKEEQAKSVFEGSGSEDEEDQKHKELQEQQERKENPWAWLKKWNEDGEDQKHKEEQAYNERMKKIRKELQEQRRNELEDKQTIKKHEMNKELQEKRNTQICKDWLS